MFIVDTNDEDNGFFSTLAIRFASFIRMRSA